MHKDSDFLKHDSSCSSVWSVVVWYVLFTFQVLIWLLWILCPFGKISMLHLCYLLHTFSCLSGILFKILTAKIKMVMPELFNRMLLHPHILCQPLIRRVCFVALVTIKLQILHSHSKNRNIRKHDFILHFFSIFCILSRFSLLYWLSCSFIDIYCFFRSVTNLHTYSSCSSPLPPPRSSNACFRSFGPGDLCQLVHGCCS